MKIAADGSTAAFVPNRGMTWQTTDTVTPVVRERVWITFQPGEVRVCASCHGVNKADQAGLAAPTNKARGTACAGALLEHAALRKRLRCGMPARHARQHLQHPPGGLARLSIGKRLPSIHCRPLAHQPAGGGQPGLAQLARLVPARKPTGQRGGWRAIRRSSVCGSVS